MNYVILNGELLPEDEARIPLADRGFRYGDGVFETLRVEGGVPYQFEWHMRRLEGGLNACKIDFDVNSLAPHVRTLLQKNKVTGGILRLQVTRGAGGRGYWPDTAATPLLVIETAPLPVIPEAPVALWQSAYEKISPRALPTQYKLCQGMNSTLARMEAAEHQCADALLLNERKEICETSSGNIFWIKDKMLYTPALSCGPLEGATRAAIVRLSPMPVKEVAATLEDMEKAEAVFITNSVWRTIAVNQLLPQGTQWNSAAVALRFRELLAEDTAQYCKAHRDRW